MIQVSVSNRKDSANRQMSCHSKGLALNSSSQADCTTLFVVLRDIFVVWNCSLVCFLQMLQGHLLLRAAGMSKIMWIPDWISNPISFDDISFSYYHYYLKVDSSRTKEAASAVSQRNGSWYKIYRIYIENRETNLLGVFCSAVFCIFLFLVVFFFFVHAASQRNRRNHAAILFTMG